MIVDDPGLLLPFHALSLENAREHLLWFQFGLQPVGRDFGEPPAWMSQPRIRWETNLGSLLHSGLFTFLSKNDDEEEDKDKDKDDDDDDDDATLNPKMETPQGKQKPRKMSWPRKPWNNNALNQGLNLWPLCSSWHPELLGAAFRCRLRSAWSCLVMILSPGSICSAAW